MIMADSHRSTHPFLSFLLLLLLLLLLTRAASGERKQEESRGENSTEFPAESIDPAAIDLTTLVNTLMNSSQSGSRQLFSLLSVTSYSALDLHKLTLLVYNVSSVRSFSSSWFRRRFCYCVTNQTNDFTDFTAILLDVMGNSTSYVHELFKSASILSVSQRNQSTCTHICVMAGRTGAEASELWELRSITPIFNQTIVEGPRPASEMQQPTGRSHVSALTVRVQAADAETATVTTNTTQQSAETRQPRPEEPTPGSGPQPATEEPTPGSGPQPAAEEPTVQQPATFQGMTEEARPQPPTAEPGRAATQPATSASAATLSSLETTKETDAAAATQTVTGLQATMSAWKTAESAKKTTLPSMLLPKPGCPWRQSAWTVDPAAAVGMTTIGADRLQPCVLELCSFFSQCLCGRLHHKTHLKRFCVKGHVWYQKHTPEVCRRARRISLSRNLKQRCLTKMCEKL